MKVNFENLFKNKFKNYQIQPDSNIWNNIEKQIDSKNTPKKFSKFAILSSVVIFVAGAILFTTQKNTQTKTLQPQKSNYSITTTRTSTIFGNAQVTENQHNKITHNTKIIVAYSNTHEVNIQQTNNDSIIADDTPQIKRNYRGFQLSANSGCCPLQLVVKNLDKSEDITWTINGETFSNKDEFTVNLDEPGEYEISLTHHNPTEEFKQTVIVFGSPKANFTSTNKTYTKQQTKFENKSQNSTEYQWLVNDKKVSDDKNLTYIFSQTGKYKITLIAYGKKCADTLEKNIEVVEMPENIVFPTAFVPSPYGSNGGYYSKTNTHDNSVFHPYILTKEIKEYKLSIFDRNGNLLFESNDINIGWDGYINGHIAPFDVYIYIAKGIFEDGTAFNKKGNVTLVKNR